MLRSSSDDLALLEQEFYDALDRACREKVVSHVAGPMFWLRCLTATENYQWQEQGLSPQEPFPYKPHPDVDLTALPFTVEAEHFPDGPPDYMDVVCWYLLHTKELFIPKTREMMTSWLTVGFIAWHCQFFPQVQWVSQSEKELKAQGLIRYANILYRNQQPWMKALHPLRRGTEATKQQIEWEHGSDYRALPEGERQLASMHPHGYYSDETAHQAAAEATINIVKPAARQLVYVSSVAPGWMWNQVQHV